MEEIEDVKDIVEYLTIFSLGDETNRKILDFLSKVSLNYAKSDSTKDDIGEASDLDSLEDEGSGESDNSPDEDTDEYYDSDENM